MSAPSELGKYRDQICRRGRKHHNGFLYCHFGPSLGPEVVASFEIVCNSLLRMLLTIKVLHSVTGFLVSLKPSFVFVGVKPEFSFTVPDLYLEPRPVVDDSMLLS